MGTFGELPAITLALPAVQDDGQRWTRWGAAQGGAKEGIGAVAAAGILLICILALALTFVAPQIVLTAALALVTAIYLTAGVQKVVNLIAGMKVRQVSATNDLPDPLPFYTVLVPLHREQAILPVLVTRLSALDYPVERLEVLLLVEQADHETQSVLEDIDLPAHFHMVLVPEGEPKTKPRALNVGLSVADGDYIVVYDAEDRPEPDQLKKAVARFSQSDSKLVCLQARLGIYNTDQSWLTKLFSLDYLIWFSALLPGLDLVPLGGTSNHFRTRALRRLGGWDPYNVTEDADIGVRIGRAGLAIGLLDSTTREEAVPTARAWLRQRSRWVKGYLQTYLVHMRNPRKLARDLGWRRLLTPTATFAPTSTPAPTATPAPAPDLALSLSGTQIMRGGQPFTLMGAARYSLEFECHGDGHFQLADFLAMRFWGMNIVRIPLSSAFWRNLDGKCPDYQTTVAAAVASAEQAGLYVILDIQRDAPFSTAQDAIAGGSQCPLPDQYDAALWRQAAQTYRDDQRVLFDLFGEPYNASAAQWAHGGAITTTCSPSYAQAMTYHAIGMSDLAGQVRALAPHNLIILSGLGWGYDLSQIQPVKLPGILYATHPWNHGNYEGPWDWARAFGNVAKSLPVIATEFGAYDCQTGYIATEIAYFEKLHMSFLAWPWTTGNCTDLIANWNGMPTTPYGAYIRQQMLQLAVGH